MPLTLFNDLAREKQIFEPIEKGKVRFYTCGPTVYDYFHIGNARPFIIFDSLRRYLEYLGFEVNYVQNFTDIDDKMITRAAQLGISVPELANRFIDAYREDSEALGVRAPTSAPLATDHMAEIINLVIRLIETGHAYEVDGDVYFEVLSFPGYGHLVKQSLDDLLSGARIEVDARKKHPLDFALWKAKKEGEPSWNSPWGEGRPGWHIECSAMSMKMLGDTIDIHAGGSDLVFPHHENEIAQAEAATGKPFVRYWIHNGFLLIDKEKMSKSLGNFLTAREARSRFSPLAIRLFMLGAHYRSPLSFSDDSLQQAESGIIRIKNCLADLSSTPADQSTSFDPAASSFLKNAFRRFNEALDDDFNTAGAIGVLFDVVRMVNTAIAGMNQVSPDFCSAALEFFRHADNILGISPISKAANFQTPVSDSEIDKLIAERDFARKNNNFERADEIREELSSRGIILEDTARGTRWKR